MNAPNARASAAPTSASVSDAVGAELAGWERRFVGAPPRLREHVELYESLGLEVRLEPVAAAELSPECAGCALALTLFRVIYTRRRS